MTKQRINFETRRYGKERYIVMGENRFDPSQKVYYPERRGAGVVIFEANPGQGKSILAGSMAVQISKYRPIVIFDYMGEHAKLKYPNTLSQSKNYQSIPNLKTQNGVKFKVSQFNNIQDWLSLGFGQNASELAMTIARAQEVHRDKPEFFLQIIEDINAHETWRLKRDYEIQLPKNVHPAVVQKLQKEAKWLIRDDFFADENSPMFDAGRFVYENGHIVLDFQQEKTRSTYFRANAGKSMQQIYGWSKYIRGRYGVLPLWLIEEADTLAPNIFEDSDNYISSLEWMKRAVLKLQKQGLELFLIVQNTKNLHPEIAREWDGLILGPKGDGYYSEKRKKLNWDIAGNYREFLYVQKGGNPPYYVFIPDDPPFRYWS